MYRYPLSAQGVGMLLKPGQVVLYRANLRQRKSTLISLLLESPWSHVSLVTTGGGFDEAQVLNTYPATDAVLTPLSDLVRGRDIYVLDLPAVDESWRERVVDQAHGLLGSEYWLSPCSRLTALAFLRAGVRFYRSGAQNYREMVGWITPEEYLTRSRLRAVYSNHQNAN